jgi:hypothetical protein
MMKIHESSLRGRTRIDWLDSRHSFSFGNFHDTARMGFRALRVINEDHIAGKNGFPPHNHAHMDIITIVLTGGLAHRDSLGNGSIIHPGEIQHMYAGPGITHSEMNPADESVHLLQIWIQPDRPVTNASYSQHEIDAPSVENRFGVIAGEGSNVPLQSDTRLLLARLGEGETATHGLGSGRGAWVQVMKGNVQIDGQSLSAGDGAEIEEVGEVAVRAKTPAELLLFDLG